MAEPKIFLPRGTAGQLLPSDMFARELVWTDQIKQLWIRGFDGIGYPVGGPYSQYYSVVSDDYIAKPAERILADTKTSAWTLTLPPVQAVGCPVSVVTIGGHALTVDGNGQTINDTNQSVSILPDSVALFVQTSSGWAYVCESTKTESLDTRVLALEQASIQSHLVTADYQITGTGSRFYLVDATTSPLIDLPDPPIAPILGQIQHLIVINTMGSTGLVTVSPGSFPINGVYRSIALPPARRVEMAWIGGNIGWVTDAQYTNRAIGAPVYQQGQWAVVPSNLSAATDGNPGTATGYGHTVGTHNNKVIVYCDLGEVLQVTYARVTGYWGWPITDVWSYGGERDMGIWYSTSDPQANPETGTWLSIISPQQLNGVVVPYAFDLTGVATPVSMRYVGVRFGNRSNPSVGFNIQEIEVS